MTLPNFLVIGAAKSGTTALYAYLRQHPQIFMSAVKEPMYFAYAERPPCSQGPGDFVNTAITSWAAYTALFAGAKDAVAIGEASPVYLYSPAAPSHIATTLPDAKLIVILRHPVQRAWSAYLHKRRNGVEPFDNFMDALAAEQTRMAADWGPLWHYKNMGYYTAQLSRYYALFPQAQIGVWLHDHLQRDSVGVLQAMFRFLGVDDPFVPDMSLRPNVSGTAKNVWLHRFYTKLFGRDNPIKSIAQKTLPEAWRVRVTTTLRNRNTERAIIPDDAKAYLNSLYAPEISALQTLIKQDLSHWKR